MSLELTGKVIKILPGQSGSGKNGTWTKQDFIIETPGEYPRKVCISTWGEKASELKNLSIGDNIKVSVNIESREYNDRWYTDVRAWKIEKMGQQQTNPIASPDFPLDDIPPAEERDNLPF